MATATSLDPNLAAARKIEPNIDSVLGRASAVAIYDFKDGNWVKSEHEGALLVCSRTTDPPFCILILNQIKPQNFFETIGSTTQLQRKGEYLLYRISTQKDVRALWFYNLDECEHIHEVLQAAMDSKAKGDAPSASATGQKASTGQKAPTPMRIQQQQQPKVASTPGQPVTDGRNISSKDILALLKKASKDVVKSDDNGQASVSSDLSNQAGGSGDGGGGLQFLSAAGVENLFRSVASTQNGSSISGSTITMVAPMGDSSITREMRGVKPNPHFPNTIPLTKGRGRCLEANTADVPVAVQQLFGGASRNAFDQTASSAFTNVGRMNMGGPQIGMNDFITAAADAQTATTVSPHSAMAEDLLTPADLRATENRNRVFASEMNQYSPPAGSVGGQISYPNSAKNQNGLTDEELRRAINHLMQTDSGYVCGIVINALEENPSFLDKLDQLLCRRRLQRDLSDNGGGVGGSMGNR